MTDANFDTLSYHEFADGRFLTRNMMKWFWDNYTTSASERARYWQQMQRQLTTDAVNAWIFNPAQVAVARKGLKGLWASSPIFANDIAAVRWGQ